MRKTSLAVKVAGAVMVVAILAACSNRVFNPTAANSGDTKRIQVGELVDGSVLY